MMPTTGSMPLTCTEVRTLVMATDISPEQHADVSAHVTDCAICCGGLVLLLASALGAPEPTVVTCCAACERDLAAYLDLGADADIVAAACAYPHVYWHLLVCAPCAQVAAVVADGREVIASDRHQGGF